MSRKREAPAAVAPAGAVAAGRVGVRRFRVTVGPWSVHARESVGAVGYPPVVLVHGVVVSGHYMVPTIEVLGRYRHVYAPDLPGFGRSGGPRAPMDIPGLAASLAGWMRAAGIEKADVVAHSFGCQIAAEFAARNPERVGRLALLGPTGNPENRSVIAQIGHWALDCVRVPLQQLPVERAGRPVYGRLVTSEDAVPVHRLAPPRGFPQVRVLRMPEDLGHVVAGAES
jgi:pimeloyl-ACP methyl ester carboxylesterase